MGVLSWVCVQCAEERNMNPWSGFEGSLELGDRAFHSFEEWIARNRAPAMRANYLSS